MGEVSETPLPGVGVRFELGTASGRQVGVVVHQTGRRDLVVYDAGDPDSAAESVELTADEALTLGELLGGSQVLERLEDAIHRIDDLVIAWVRIDAASPVAGVSLAEASFRSATGAGVVALVAETGSIPVPGGSDRLRPGDTAVVVGLPPAVERATALLAPG